MRRAPVVPVTTVVCPTAVSALTLATVLEQEAHAALWFMGRVGGGPARPTVLTTAPHDVLHACIDTALSLLGQQASTVH